MSTELPIIYVARHGETAWSRSGQHTGLTDIPLSTDGERDAELLADRLKRIPFQKVLTSPLMRVIRTCELAGFGSVAEVDRDLVEWDYGVYEGKTTKQIRAGRPDWRLFRDGCPGGESLDQVGARADRVIARVRATGGNVLLFSSGHIIRILAARWLGLEPEAGRLFMLVTGSLSALGYEHDLNEPVIRFWDDMSHIA